MSQGNGEEVELPLESVGVKLLRAREAAGMARSQMAALTRIPERHLAAIEAGDFRALPARTYAVGFSRSYAKALGLDEAAIAGEVRAELAAQEPEVQRRSLPTFEPGDPARVPSARLAWLAALGTFALFVGGLLLWRGPWTSGGSLPSILPRETPAPVATAATAPAPASGAPAAEQPRQQAPRQSPQPRPARPGVAAVAVPTPVPPEVEAPTMADPAPTPSAT